MSDEVEQRLHAGFAADLPAAPSSLRSGLGSIVELEAPARRARPVLWLVATALALAFIGAVAFSAGVAPPTPPPSLGPEPTASLVPTESPSLADGAMTVSELVDARRRGEIAGETVLLRGFWSDRATPIDCSEIPGPSADLESWCGQYGRGIAEFDEPIWTEVQGDLKPALGPVLRPFVEPDLRESLPSREDDQGRLIPPTPIVLAGHFDDERAADCLRYMQPECMERFVIDRIVEVGEGALPTEVEPAPIPAVWTVGDLLAARLAGDVGGDTVRVMGYWTDRSFPHSCAPMLDVTSPLDDLCGAGEYGITEQDEPIMTLAPGFRIIPASGPALSPFLDEPVDARLFQLPHANGQSYPPVPIVVEGHFDDPRADECRPATIQRCRDRFVVERVLEFDPGAAPTPGITAPPSPFPFEDPPPAPFGRDRCFGDLPYSFIGWGMLSDVGVDIGAGEVVFMMVTADEMDLGRGRTGRRVCYAYEWDDGVVGFATLP